MVLTFCINYLKTVYFLAFQVEDQLSNALIRADSNFDQGTSDVDSQIDSCKDLHLHKNWIKKNSSEIHEKINLKILKFKSQLRK